MSQEVILFNRPYLTGDEESYLATASQSLSLSGDGPFTKHCHQWLKQQTGSAGALLTQSCTAALEMAALLLDIQPGDEIIMPSYTFVSTANAFVLRGGVPVFVDIREDTCNLDERLIEAAITPRTKAIVPVHYAGVACDMEAIMRIATTHGLTVIEDAAQGVMASYQGRALGSIGAFGAFSFHETKNIISGEGGALLINRAQDALQAEIIREKGTDRSRFFRGEVDKYTWQTVGSSFLPSELTAAFLWAQLQSAEKITTSRLAIWDYYHALLAEHEAHGLLRRPMIPSDCQHNAHMYYVLLPSALDRAQLLKALRAEGICAISHYVPLHSSPAGQHYGRPDGDLSKTNHISECLLRLPLWVGMTEMQQQRVVDCLISKVHALMGSNPIEVL